MKIDTTILLPVIAVVASVLLLMAGRQRVFEVLLVVASGAWLLLQLGIFNWPLHHEYGSSGIVIGGVLLVGSLFIYLKTDNKREVTSATALAIMGGTMLLAALNKLG